MIWMKRMHIINWMYYGIQTVEIDKSNLLTGICYYEVLNFIQGNICNCSSKNLEKMFVINTKANQHIILIIPRRKKFDRNTIFFQVFLKLASAFGSSSLWDGFQSPFFSEMSWNIEVIFLGYIIFG